MKKPNFEASEDTTRCADYLRTRQRVSYSELSAHVGRDVQRRFRYILENARHKLERESIVFVTETGVGLVRATDEQVARLSTSTPIEKIRRTTRRAKKREKIVNVQSLSEADRAAFYVGRAVLGAIAQASREAFVNQVTGAVNAAADGEPLSIEATMRLFSKLKPDRIVQ